MSIPPEDLATAWVAYWTSSPAYGNGTPHPKHTALMKQIREAYPENTQAQARPALLDAECSKQPKNETK